MKMDLMITVSYSLEIPREDYFKAESGTIKEEIEERLEALFPEKFALTGRDTAHREHLISYPLVENHNSLRCASCGRWLYMPGKEYLPVCLDPCKMVKQIPLCPSCAWELENDMEQEAFVQKLREKSTMNGGTKKSTV